jgi:hypothetical protein
MWGETPFATPSSSLEELAASSPTDGEREKGDRRGSGEDNEPDVHSVRRMGRAQGTRMNEHGDVIAEGISTSASDSPLAGEWNHEECQRDLEETESMAISLGGALPSEAWWRSMGPLLLAQRLACWVS